jgi:transforming growth factor-beta-induced protein
MKHAKFGYLLPIVVLFAIGWAAAQQPKDIVETAAADRSLSTTVSFLRSSGMATILKKNGPYTLFAPTDAAFARLPVDITRKLHENPMLLGMLLNNYIVSGTVAAGSLSQLPRLRTLQGRNLALRYSAGKLLVNSGKIVTPDIVARNGVIHKIDNVDIRLIHEFLDTLKKSEIRAQNQPEPR